MAHTPGPWVAVLENDPRGQPVPYYRGLVATVEHGARYLAVVTQTGRSVPKDEWEANARLIASAPDLLEALEDTIRVLHFGFEEGAIPEDIVAGLCIDPYGTLADAKRAYEAAGGKITDWSLATLGARGEG